MLIDIVTTLFVKPLECTKELCTIIFYLTLFRFFRQFLAFFALHQMALSLFRFIAALGRTQVVANTLGTFTLLMVFVLGGFIIAKGQYMSLHIFSAFYLIYSTLHKFLHILHCRFDILVYIILLRRH